MKYAVYFYLYSNDAIKVLLQFNDLTSEEVSLILPVLGQTIYVIGEEVIVNKIYRSYDKNPDITAWVVACQSVEKKLKSIAFYLLVVALQPSKSLQRAFL